MQNNLSSRQLATKFLKAFICLPAEIFILGVTFLGEIFAKLSEMKTGVFKAKLREPRR